MRNRILSNFCLCILCIATIATTCGVVAAQPQSGSAERILFDATNRERAAHGLPALRWDNALASAARQHAQLMAQRNALSHQFSGEPPLEDRARQSGAHYTVIAENVGEGPDAPGIHNEWMHSPPHRANILDADLDAIGIAVAKRGSQLFAVQDFSRQGETLTLAQQEEQVAAMLAARGLQISGAAVEYARKACSAGQGFTPSRAGALVRWEDSDLRHLPDTLLQNIQTGRYHSASLAACNPTGSNGFTRFRLAVLLF